MTDNKNYYEILGLQDNATDEDIKNSYRKLAMLYHPDRNVDKSEQEKIKAETKFKEISNAYNVLSDPEKKQMYDKFGSIDSNNIDDFTFPFPNIFNPFVSNNFDNMFKKMFNNSSEEDDIIYITKQYTLEDLYKGKLDKAKIKRLNLCQKCDSTGFEDKKNHICKNCKGKGMKTKIRNYGNMIQQYNEPCNSCNSSGTENGHKKCDVCKGNKLTREEVEIKFEIEKGSSCKIPIIIEKMGNQQTNKKRGDIVINIEEIPHGIFKRNFVVKGIKDYIDPADLLYECQIDLAESLCGFKKVIKHLDGSELTICHEKIVRENDVFKIENKGMPEFKEKRMGDLYVLIKIKYPENLNNDVKSKIYKLLTNKDYVETKSKNNVHLKSVKKGK